VKPRYGTHLLGDAGGEPPPNSGIVEIERLDVDADAIHDPRRRRRESRESRTTDVSLDLHARTRATRIYDPPASAAIAVPVAVEVKGQARPRADIHERDFAAGVNRGRERWEEIRAPAYLVHLVAVAGAEVG